MRLPLATGKPVLGVADKSCLLTLASTQGGSVEGGCRRRHKVRKKVFERKAQKQGP